MRAHHHTPRWWATFEDEREADRAAQTRARDRRASSAALLSPLMDGLLLAQADITAALIDVQELSAADYQHLRGCALAMATAFGAIHDAIVYDARVLPSGRPRSFDLERGDD